MIAENEANRRNQALIDGLIKQRSIQTPHVEAAFRAVLRHEYLPDIPLDQVYENEPIIIKRGGGEILSCSSRPSTMALMLEQLRLEPGQRVLEIGTGTGYNAALMAHMVGPRGQIVTIDIDADLVESASQRLAAAGYDNVHAIAGDGGFGFAAGAPYDRIIVTASSDDVAQAWREQLAINGQLLTSLRTGGIEKLVLFEHERNKAACLLGTILQDFHCVSMRGSLSLATNAAQIAPDVTLSFPLTKPEIDMNKLRQVFMGESHHLATAVQAAVYEVDSSLYFYLMLHEPDLCAVTVQGASARRSNMPFLLGRPGDMHYALGLVDHAGLALLSRPQAQIHQPGSVDLQSFDLIVKIYGNEGSAARRLIKRIKAWDAAGRPTDAGLQLRAYPTAAKYRAKSGELLVKRPQSHFVYRWPS